MRRLILNEAPDAGGKFRLWGKDLRYIARVLRMTAGDSFRALLPDGREILARIASIDKESLEAVAVGDTQDRSLEADGVRRRAVGRLPPIVLLQALPKAQKMDLIVRQATEAGVALILPFIAEHSVSRPGPGKDAENKRERWERVIREARQQSGSDTATEIREPRDLARALDDWRKFAAQRGEAIGIFLHQAPLAQGSMHGYLSGDPQSVAVAVGPEGGFSPAETGVMAAAGFFPALLGENVLRAETAATFALAAVQVILLEKESWIPKNRRLPESNA